MKLISQNRRAKHDYEILSKWEAGIILTGAEVKSAKLGHVNLKGSYVVPHKNGLLLINCHISPYQKAGHSQKTYNPVRNRKLLIHQAELKKIAGRLGGQNSGLTLVPLSVYNKKGFLKIEFGLGKGRKKYDKRQLIKKREAKRRISRAIKGK